MLHKLGLDRFPFICLYLPSCIVKLALNSSRAQIEFAFWISLEMYSRQVLSAGLYQCGDVQDSRLNWFLRIGNSRKTLRWHFCRWGWRVYILRGKDRGLGLGAEKWPKKYGRRENKSRKSFLFAFSVTIQFRWFLTGKAPFWIENKTDGKFFNVNILISSGWNIREIHSVPW